jgi:hypothetical protein
MRTLGGISSATRNYHESAILKPGHLRIFIDRTAHGGCDHQSSGGDCDTQFVNYRVRGIDSQMKSDLKNAAIAMDSYFAQHQQYPTSTSGISAFGFNQTAGVTLTITITSPSSFTLVASKEGGSQANFTYSSTTGTIN